MKTRINYFLIFFVGLFFLQSALQANELTQTFRGEVVDAFSGLPLPGATVLIEATDPLIGATTNADGAFKIENLPLGRINARVSMVGYKTQNLTNLLLAAGKELVVKVRLDEQVYQLSEVEIRPDVRKDQPVNEMAMISARSFNIDETERYAGSLGDPSRMASNFAGVSSASDERNDIIIRGNSPLGLLWRLEGVDIPNPNHFGSIGSTGGPISMLNNNLLANSDFFTGAFPAEYGNALAGAFDIKMRNGNNQRHEFLGQVGFNGFEAGAEGPLGKNTQASYLANFRYSTMEVFNELGMDFGTGSAVPKYKDLSFKINMPLKNGKLTVFGLGGDNSIAMLDSKNDDAGIGFTGTDLYYGNKMGVMGVNHLLYLNEDTWFTNTVAVTGIEGDVTIYDLSNTTDKPEILETLSEVKYTLSSKFSKRFNSKNYLNSGFILDYYDVGYIGREYLNDKDLYRKYLDNTGSMSFTRAFAEWKHRFNDELQMTSGLNSSYLFMNESFALEPRLSMKYEFVPGKSFRLGAGMHSQMQMRAVYFTQSLADTLNMTYEQTNHNLDLTRSVHLVAGYEQLLGENHRLKSEVYYQYLYDAPVAPQRPEYSLLNQGGGYSFLAYSNMINSGKGKNMGVELTLEKFLTDGFYYLFTASIFDSKYQGYDEVWRNSAFNNNYIFNVLTGYEWKTGNRSLLAVDMKVVYAGGTRQMPIDVETSTIENAERYDWENAFNERLEDYFRINARISFRLNGNNLNQEWALDLQNLTNHQNVFTQSWDKETNQIDTSYQMGFMPMMTYKIYF